MRRRKFLQLLSLVPVVPSALATPPEIKPNLIKLGVDVASPHPLSPLVITCNDKGSQDFTYKVWAYNDSDDGIAKDITAYVINVCRTREEL